MPDRTDVEVGGLNEKERDVLEYLAAFARGRSAAILGGWARPLDIGGRDASHHSNTLRRLAERGLVDMKQRGTDEPWSVEKIKNMKGRFARRNIRGARGGPKEYRINDAGQAALAKMGETNATE